MPDIATALKEEIRRLARKEIRAQTETTLRAAKQHRREIAQLKRQLEQQEKKISALQSQGRKPVAAAVPAEADMPEGVRFSARSVRAQRKRLKVSAEQFAKLLGVSMQTVYAWEQGRARPRQAQLALLVAARSLGRREVKQRLATIK